MEERFLHVAIKDEDHEGGPLWFDLRKPEVLAQYLQDNAERGEEYTFFVKDLSQAEMDELSED